MRPRTAWGRSRAGEVALKPVALRSYVARYIAEPQWHAPAETARADGSRAVLVSGRLGLAYSQHDRARVVARDLHLIIVVRVPATHMRPQVVVPRGCATCGPRGCATCGPRGCATWLCHVWATVTVSDRCSQGVREGAIRPSPAQHIARRPKSSHIAHKHNPKRSEGAAAPCLQSRKLRRARARTECGAAGMQGGGAPLA